MKAWLLDKIGDGVDGLRLATVTDPSAERGEVVVDVTLAALNPADRYLAEGLYPAKPSFPHVLGRDGLGTVAEVGDDVHELKVGDRVLVLRSEVGVSRPGTLAEKVAVPAESLVAMPDGWTDEQTAGAPLVYLTAYQALTMWGDLPPSVLLVTGASGGVGVASVQLGRALGHTIVALSRDAQKRNQLERLGADHTLDPTDRGWVGELKKLLGRRRVDIAVDNVGGPLFPQIIETLADQGRIGCVGALAGPVPSFNTATLFFRRVRIGGVMVGAYTPTESRAVWQNVLKLMGQVGARPLVDQVFPFGELKQAFARLKEGPMGKVVVDVRG